MVFALALSPCSEGKDKPSFWERVFMPAKAKTKSKKRKVIRRQPKPQPKRSIQKEKTYVVNKEWMVRYWGLVWEHNYSIPEENEIRYVDDKIYVPVVVYWHMRDMMEASKY